jgi:hypothetical protein
MLNMRRKIVSYSQKKTSLYKSTLRWLKFVVSNFKAVIVYSYKHLQEISI